jgi:exodeoxyribonuclease VII large subunit
MFAGQAAGLDFRLENGMQVVIEGRVDIYERDGKYQLYALTVALDGIGDLYKQFEELKSRFSEMGYFSAEYKQKIPQYARKIGIVTAATGAAIHDIMNISYRRNPYVSLILFPALVQGERAKYSIVRGIQTLDGMGLDVLIVGRGGGSIEDLWAFNEAIVAEAIFNAKTPVISAVGHETDFTIADFVSDLRAPTPSAAAELAVADITVTEGRILACQQALNHALMRKIESYRNQLSKYELQLKFMNPVNKVNDSRQQLMAMEDKLHQLMSTVLTAKRHQLEIYASRLNGVSPLAKLSQGYSYVQNFDGRQISSVNDVEKGDQMQLYVKDGVINAQVLDTKKNKEVSDGKIANT